MAAKVLSVLVLLCAVLWPLSVRVEDEAARDGDGPHPRALSPAEQVTVELLEAMKQGDAETFLALLDLEVLYADAEKRGEDVADYDEFAAQVRRSAEAEFAGGPAEEMEYEVEGNGRVVTVRVRYAKDAPWREHPVEFTGAGSATRITLKGMKALDFGYGVGGPIARTDTGGDAGVAVRALLEAMKAKDAKTSLKYMDLKGIYEKAVPGPLREQMPFERFRDDMLGANEKPTDTGVRFDYEVVEITVKDDVATADIRMKTRADENWKDRTIRFKKIDGAWKLTVEGLLALGN